MGEIINQEVPYTGKGAILHKGVLYTGGGSNLVETVLWTNPSPSSSFATQNVLLSDDINNYDYIGIEYGYNINTQSDGRKVVFMKVSDFKTTNSNVGYRLGMSVYQGTNNNAFNRICNYIDDTHISFVSCAQYGSGGYTTNNNISIPTRIIGVKKAGSQVGIIPGSEIPNSALTSYNSEWTATEDCVMCGTITGTSSYIAQLFVGSRDSANCIILAFAQTNIGRDYSGNLTNFGMFIPKGTKLLTRTEGGNNQYDLHFYKIV